MAKKPTIKWSGNTKMVATVCGHRIGFVEEWPCKYDESKMSYRWDSRYSTDSWRPNYDTKEEAKARIEKDFMAWLKSVCEEIGS